MTVIVDIDGTLCVTPGGRKPDYAKARPISRRIARLNEMFFNRGWRVVVATARGGTTGMDWRGVTERQLEEWGVKYHELIIPKNKHLLPEYDAWVDDKAQNASVLDE